VFRREGKSSRSLALTDIRTARWNAVWFEAKNNG
jgi:hypothetical protein